MRNDMKPLTKKVLARLKKDGWRLYPSTTVCDVLYIAGLPNLDPSHRDVWCIRNMPQARVALQLVEWIPIGCLNAYQKDGEAYAKCGLEYHLIVVEKARCEPFFNAMGPNVKVHMAEDIIREGLLP